MKYEINDIYELPVIAQVAILLVFSIIIFIVGYQLTISDLSSQVVNSYREEDKLLLVYTDTVDQQVELKHHVMQLPQLKKLLSESENKLITDPELTRLMDEILKLGATNSIKFQLFDPKEKIKQNNFIIAPIDITMIGTYDHIAHFMSQVANLPKVVKVGNFTMSNETFDSSTSNAPPPSLTIDTLLKTRLTLEVYESTI